MFSQLLFRLQLSINLPVILLVLPLQKKKNLTCLAHNTSKGYVLNNNFYAHRQFLFTENDIHNFRS